MEIYHEKYITIDEGRSKIDRLKLLGLTYRKISARLNDNCLGMIIIVVHPGDEHQYNKYLVSDPNVGPEMTEAEKMSKQLAESIEHMRRQFSYSLSGTYADKIRMLEVRAALEKLGKLALPSVETISRNEQIRKDALWSGLHSS